MADQCPVGGRPGLMAVGTRDPARSNEPLNPLRFFERSDCTGVAIGQREPAGVSRRGSA
jgi:hypothetical protein